MGNPMTENGREENLWTQKGFRKEALRGSEKQSCLRHRLILARYR